jgi:hypothetical protein
VIESEIPHGPRLSLALRARRGLLVLGCALGLPAAGASVQVGAQRRATQAYLTLPEGPSCVAWGGCSDSWWEWPGEKSPYDAPPTAILPGRPRIA